MTSAHLSMNCLYSAPRMAPKSMLLDPHYVMQMEGMCREDLWTVLRESTKSFDESIKAAEADCLLFHAAMMPIYKCV